MDDPALGDVWQSIQYLLTGTKTGSVVAHSSGRVHRRSRSAQRSLSERLVVGSTGHPRAEALEALAEWRLLMIEESHEPSCGWSVSARATGGVISIAGQNGQDAGAGVAAR